LSFSLVFRGARRPSILVKQAIHYFEFGFLRREAIAGS
jgi:hypothetical protein